MFTDKYTAVYMAVQSEIKTRAMGQCPPEGQSFLILERPTEGKNLLRCPFLQTSQLAKKW